MPAAGSGPLGADFQPDYSTSHLEAVTYALINPGPTFVNEPVPSGYLARVESFQCRFITDAAVANRVLEVQLVFPNATNAITVATPQVQTASLTWTYQWLLGDLAYTNASGNYAQGNLPDMIVPAGGAFKLIGVNTAGNDGVLSGTLVWRLFENTPRVDAQQFFATPVLV